ncbi:MAG: hypothetical protein IJM25_08380 [Eubacterium sp.]|nr:hypothetical protein [Eubacterium sp.]
MGKRKRKIIYFLLAVISVSLLMSEGALSPEAAGSSDAYEAVKGNVPDRTVEGRILEWTCRITEDVTEGEFLTKRLGMDLVTRQSVMETLRANWDEGLKYHSSAYSVTHADAASCVNYGGRQYVGRERTGYGYNCTGFVASVLYYANGGGAEDALTKMKEFYRPLSRGGSFTDGTGWYYYMEPEKASEGSDAPEGTKVYFLGETKDSDAMQAALTEAERTGKVREGYILFFWPSDGWDCHFGIYAGKDADGVHQMYHAAGTYHSGVHMNTSIDLTRVTSEGPSYMYVIPLPDAEGDLPWGEPGWQTLEGVRVHFGPDRKMTLGWYEEDWQRFYFDPETGSLALGWQEIEGTRVYFCKDGHLARNCIFGLNIVDEYGVCHEPGE